MTDTEITAAAAALAELMMVTFETIDIIHHAGLFGQESKSAELIADIGHFLIEKIDGQAIVTDFCPN